MTTAVGVDVSVARGLDVVALDGGDRVIGAWSSVDPAGLQALLERHRPAAVAIDAPPGPARDPAATSRACERELRALGVHIFLTPGDPDRYAHRFYDWVRVGALAYAAAARAGYPLQDDPAVTRHRALEVFPHASDVFLRGHLPPPGTTRRTRTKRAWRLATLQQAGVGTAGLCRNRRGEPTLDSIDAALAALTAGRAAAGRFTAVGRDGEWIVVPGTPGRPFPRPA